MRKVFLMFVLSFVIMAQLQVEAQLPWVPDSAFIKEKPEQIKPLDDIMVYCNTKEFVNNMVQKDYNLNLAAKGFVNDEKHKDVLESQLWMNPINNQWAIVFIYKNINRSCVIGGNNIELYSP
jgi:hypothetical protein